MLSLAKSSPQMKALLALNLTLILVLGAPVPAGYSATRADAANRGDSTGLTLKKMDTAPVGVATNQRVKNALNKLPISFEANRGQADSKIKFISHGSGYSLSLTSNEAVLNLSRPLKTTNERKSLAGGEKADLSGAWQKAVIRMKLAGTNSSPRVQGLDELPGKVNYFKGNDPTKWQTNVANYSRVRYQQVYPGIDLIYHGDGQQLEYDFIVAPGVDPKNIRMEFNGAKKLEVSTQGDLVLQTTLGEVHHRKPSIYQEVNGQRQEVVGRFAQHGKQVGFEIGTYDRTKPLVIDPVIAYSTLLGGDSSSSAANGIATYTAADGKVYVYAVGVTNETGFPVKNAVQPTFAGIGPGSWAGDVFVAKFKMDVSGDSSLLWSTYLGGSASDYGAGIAVDGAGNPYVTGYTGSSDFPIMKAAQTSLAGPANSTVIGDAFVTALKSDGSSLIYSTYLGGTLADEGMGIAVDTAGSAYIKGKTLGTFPIVNGLQTTHQAGRYKTYFVSKIAPPSEALPASLVYSTYLDSGGFFNDPDTGSNGIAVDSAGNAYVTGVTMSSAFPILNGFQTTLRCPQGNVFVTKLNPSLSGPASLLYSTYLGGSCDSWQHVYGDVGRAITADAAGNAYVTGETVSGDFPTTPGAFMGTRKSARTAFVSRIDSTKTGAASLIYSTLLGGPGLNGEGGNGIAVDSDGNAYVTGQTTSWDFPLVNAVQGSNSGVFQSIDDGTSWTRINNGMTVSSVSALAVDATTSPRTLYAGAPAPSGGVYKSADGGLNWNAINNGLTNTDIRSLQINPVNPSIIYAGTSGGLFRSSDGGASWISFNVGLSGDATRVNTVLADAAVINGTGTVTVYAGTDAGLYKTVEGTNTWISGGLDQIVRTLVIDSKTSPHTFYAHGSAGEPLYMSQDGSVTWGTVELQLQYPGSISIDNGTSPPTLYSVDVINEALWRSVDRGSSWEQHNLPALDLEFESTIVVDHKTVPSTVYIYNPSGLFSSKDGGITWTRSFSSGVSTLQLDTVSGAPSSVLYIGTYNQNPDSFVAELDPTGTALLFSTVLGGYGSDSGQAIALDSDRNIYVAGRTQFGPFPTVNAYQTAGEQQDADAFAFIVKLGNAVLPSVSAGSVTTQVAVQSGMLELSFPNITGSTSGTTPTATVSPLDSTTTANLTLSNNLGAYDIKTTATYNTSGYATDPTKGIKIAFSVPTVNDLAVFNNLVITHGEDSNADGVIQPGEMIPYNGTVDPNKITYHDFVTRTVWVYVPSLSPFVIVKGAGDQFSDLVRLIKSFNLKAGVENSFDAKLQNALKAYQAALAKDRATACNQMGGFISAVQAQTSKALTQAQANQLITAANQIKGVLGCR